MQVTIHESKKETYRTLGDLDVGDTFCFPGRTEKMQVIAESHNSYGDLYDDLKGKAICLNVSRGKFIIARKDSEVYSSSHWSRVLLFF